MKSNYDEISNNMGVTNQFFIQAHNLDIPPEYKILFTNDGPEIWDVNSGKSLIKYQENFKAGNEH